MVLINSFLAGFIGSTLGIGGGLIITPYLVSLGFSPKISTSTSTLTIIFSSLSSTFMFFTMGSLKIDYSLGICIPSVLTCYFCSKYINNYIKETGKQSILLYMLFWTLIVTIVFVVLSLINKIIFSIDNDISIFRFKNYCLKE